MEIARNILAVVMLFTASVFAGEPPRIYKAAILDGQNNHDWRSTTPMIKAALEKSGRFAVSILTAPPTADAAAWEKFRPNFADYDVIISNYTDFGAKPTPTWFLDELTKHIRDGGAIVIVHAANSGHDAHGEFARMVGMGWHDAKFGDRLYVDENGKTIRQAKSEGPGTAHGRPFEWTVTTWAKDHPICADLPRTWVHRTDELWAAPRGPAVDVEVLATAVAPETKQNEPVMWTVRYGKGRVFATMMGHDANSMKCTGFQAIVARGAEWAIVGGVTQPIPRDFPGAQR